MFERMKIPLTLEEHRAVAAEINAIDDGLAALMKRISNKRNVSTAVIDRVLKMDRQLARVRSDMENALFAEHSRAQGASTDVYYSRQKAEV